MLTELQELQNRYDDLLLIKNKTAAEEEEIYAIERRIQQLLFPTPRREDYDNGSEWKAFWAERHAYEDAQLAAEQVSS